MTKMAIRARLDALHFRYVDVTCYADPVPEDAPSEIVPKVRVVFPHGLGAHVYQPALTLEETARFAEVARDVEARIAREFTEHMQTT